MKTDRVNAVFFSLYETKHRELFFFGGGGAPDIIYLIDITLIILQSTVGVPHPFFCLYSVKACNQIRNIISNKQKFRSKNIKVHCNP